MGAILFQRLTHDVASPQSHQPYLRRHFYCLSYAWSLGVLRKSAEKKMANRSDILTWLQSCYQSQTDGDWEHQNGVLIQTLDNPGWMLKIDLADTELAEKEFSAINEDRGSDWIMCRVQDKNLKVLVTQPN
jgi:hypothetical protein